MEGYGGINERVCINDWACAISAANMVSLLEKPKDLAGAQEEESVSHDTSPCNGHSGRRCS